MVSSCDERGPRPQPMGAGVQARGRASQSGKIRTLDEEKIQVLIDEWVTDPMGYAGVETAGEAVQKVVQTYIGDENYLPVEIGTDPKQWASRVMECLEEAQFPTAFGLAMEAEEYTQVKEKPVKEALSDMEHLGLDDLLMNLMTPAWTL